MLRSHGQHVAQPEFEPRPSDSKAHTREHRAALPLRVLVTGGERMRALSSEGHGGCGKAADGDENQTTSHQSSVTSRPRPVAAAQCLPSVLSGRPSHFGGGKGAVGCRGRKPETELPDGRLPKEGRSVSSR